MNTTIAIQIPPVAASQEDLLRIVDSIVDYIAPTGCSYQVGPLKTAVEDGYEELLDIAREAQLICICQGADSVKFYTKIFYNPKDHLLTINEKTGRYR